ncbi:MAG: ribonuclease HI [Nocardioides sp.]|nr:ribonuclease HI [Nocardioides sp.]
MLAKFPGHCQQCLQTIKPGDPILVLGAQGPWVHEACHEAAGELLLDGVVPRAPARKGRPQRDAMTPPPGAVEVFTDGACRGNPGPGGWAWARDETTNASGHEPSSTNQRMEIRAAFEAVRAYPGPLVVVSDSTYVVNCFRDEWWKGWLRRGWTGSSKKPVANRDLWEPFVELFQDRDDVAFRWVKGHSGDPMNELVDRLAVAASHDPSMI